MSLTHSNDDKAAREKRIKDAADARMIIRAYRELVRDCQEAGILNKREDRKIIRTAFNFSRAAHRNDRRASGEPYILHPIAVASITVKEIGLHDKTSVICALVHDVVEDTQYTLSDIETLFGKSAAKIVDGLTKISHVFDPKATKEAESLRKMLLLMSDDVRVALIKIADRLHNMRTLTHMKQEKQMRIAAETKSIYAPLAHRLGLYNIKSDLEDLCLKYTQPSVFADIEAKLLASKEERDRYIAALKKPLEEMMQDLKIPATVSGRIKSINSIYEKMERQGIGFEDVYDVFAVRIVINVTDITIEEEHQLCWQVYSRIATKYRNSLMSSRIRDWLSVPRPNGYESLHLTIMDQGRWIEIQIRTQRMDLIAEKGVAAHWKYKSDNASNDPNFEKWLSRIRDLIENKQINSNEFVSEVRNIVSEHLHVFTPNGELKHLPKGATALDFAYEIHSELGNKCIGAKVNHQLVPLSHVLQNGDQVEIITSQKQKPQLGWLDYVKTSRAKLKIQEATRQERQEAIDKGRKLFEWRIKRLRLSENHRYVKDLLEAFNAKSLTEFYFLLGTKRIDQDKLANFIKERREHIDPNDLTDVVKESAVDEILQKTRGITTDALVAGELLSQAESILSECCNPIPGDEVMGVVQTNENQNTVAVHRLNCPEFEALIQRPTTRLLKLKWRDFNTVEYLTAVRIRGADRKGMLIDLVRVISLQMNIYIRSITIDTHQGAFDGIIKLYVHNTNELDKLINDIREVGGVTTVQRFDQPATQNVE